MIQLKDIMTREVYTVSPDLSLREAMDILVARHISGVPVVARGKVVGILTTMDLMTFVAGLPTMPEAGPDEDEVDEDEEPPDEFFTDREEDEGVDIAERLEGMRGLERTILDEYVVSDAMTPAPVGALGPNVAVEAAADYMRTASVHRVLVVNRGKLIGIVSAMDIARAVADHAFSRPTFVFNRTRRFDPRRATPARRRR